MTEARRPGGISLPLLTGLLASLTAIGPFAIDTYLPAFPAIAAGLGASSVEVQQSLTAYMLPFTLMTLWHGPLSDALGRRIVVLTGLLIFGLASLICMGAGSIQIFWLGRALQGAAAGAGMVVGRAMIRDVLQGAGAQRLMANVALMFALAPAVAPILGGWLFAWLGWRALFAFLALLALTLLGLCWRYLPETLPPQHRQSLDIRDMSRAYAGVLLSLPFMLLTLAVGFNFAGFFNYVLSAPVFLIEHLGLGATDFGWLFVPAVVGMMGGSFLSGRLAGRLSPLRTIGTGFAVMVTAFLINVSVCHWLPPGLPQSVLPVGLYNLGMALSMPSLTLMALDIFPERRGMASSCQSFVQSGLTSIVSAVVVPFLAGDPWSLALGMGAAMGIGMGSFLLYFLGTGQSRERGA